MGSTKCALGAVRKAGGSANMKMLEDIKRQERNRKIRAACIIGTPVLACGLLSLYAVIRVLSAILGCGAGVDIEAAPGAGSSSGFLCGNLTVLTLLTCCMCLACCGCRVVGALMQLPHQRP